MENIKDDLKRDISGCRKKLIKDIDKTGMCENFGQKDIEYLRKKYIDKSRKDCSTETLKDMKMILDDFKTWCMSYQLLYPSVAT